MMGCISIFRLPIVLRVERAVGGEERGLSNRFPVSTAQSLRHHSIVCFTTQFFRHCLAARTPPLCRSGSADVTPEKEIFLPGFKISVDVVCISSPQHLSVLSSRLLRISLSRLSSNHSYRRISFQNPSSVLLTIPPYVYLGFIYSSEHVFPWDPTLLSCLISMDSLS